MKPVRLAQSYFRFWKRVTCALQLCIAISGMVATSALASELTYQIRPGDTLSGVLWEKISSLPNSLFRLYGPHGLLAATLSLNPQIGNGDSLQPGMVILLPQLVVGVDHEGARSLASVDATEEPKVCAEPVGEMNFPSHLRFIAGIGVAMSDSQTAIAAPGFTGTLTHSGNVSFPAGDFETDFELAPEWEARGAYQVFTNKFASAAQSTFDAKEVRYQAGFRRKWGDSLKAGIDYELLKFTYLNPDSGSSSSFHGVDGTASELRPAIEYRYSPVSRVETILSADARISYAVHGSGNDSLSSSLQFAGYDVRLESHYLLTRALFAGPSLQFGSTQLHWNQTGSFTGTQTYNSTEYQFGLRVGVGF